MTRRPDMASPISEERVIPFPASARSTGDPESYSRRRREGHDVDRPNPRRARRRRQNTPWLERNALSVAAVSILIALLSVGFGLLQMINRPEVTPGLLAVGQPEPPAATSGTVMRAASTGPSLPLAPATDAATSSASLSAPARRPIQANATVLQPNYTVAAGDTLGQIATRYNTTVERIQALNNLADPRALRIGTRLVIPPPF